MAAAIVCKPDVRLDEAQLIEFCSREMAYYMVPRFLQVLADLLGVEPHTLRFGTAPRSRVAEPRMTWPAGVGSRERQTIDAYLQLSPKKRELVGELVKALSDSA